MTATEQLKEVFNDFSKIYSKQNPLFKKKMIMFEQKDDKLLQFADKKRIEIVCMLSDEFKGCADNDQVLIRYNNGYYIAEWLGVNYDEDTNLKWQLDTCIHDWETLSNLEVRQMEEVISEIKKYESNEKV